MSQDEDYAAMREAIFDLAGCISKVNGVLLQVVYGTEFSKDFDHKPIAKERLDDLLKSMDSLIGSLKKLDKSAPKND